MYSEILAIKAKQEEHNAKLKRKLDIDFTGVDTMVASQLHMTEVRCTLLLLQPYAVMLLVLAWSEAHKPAAQGIGCCAPGCLCTREPSASASISR